MAPGFIQSSMKRWTVGLSLYCRMVSGSISSDEAKIGGITPAVFTRSGK